MTFVKASNPNHSIQITMSNTETSTIENIESNYALQIAFQTMKERCQQLQNRLAVVEKENVALRLECNRNVSNAFNENKSLEQTTVKKLQGKVDELMKQKSQLSHHVIMVAAENRQLWNRLTKSMQANKSLGNHLANIMDTLKTHPSMDPDILSFSFKDGSSVKSDTIQSFQFTTDNDNKDQSLEEISLKLINNIMLEKSELEQQYAEMVELQTSSPASLQKVGFTYPEDIDETSEEHVKNYEIMMTARLIQTKEILSLQQDRLKKILLSFEKFKKGTNCKNCLKNASKKVCQTGTQITMSEIANENNSTQTSMQQIDSAESKRNGETDEHFDGNICPLCGCVASTSFKEFHRHVLSHFSE